MLPQSMCVLRPLDTSKCVCDRGSVPDPMGGAYNAPPDPLAEFFFFGGEEWRRGMQRTRYGDGKGTEGERKDEEKKGMGSY